MPTPVGSSYLDQFNPEVLEKSKVLDDALGLTHYGINLVELARDTWSTQRHWHSHEGELSLGTDAGEQILRTGMAAGFPTGGNDSQHLVNRGDQPAVYLEIDDRIVKDECHYPDIDLFLTGGTFVHKNGEPY